MWYNHWLSEMSQRCQNYVFDQINITTHWCKRELPDKQDGCTRCFEAPFASPALYCFLSDRTMYCISQVRWPILKFSSAAYNQAVSYGLSHLISFDFQPVFPCSAWHYWPCHTRVTRFSILSPNHLTSQSDWISLLNVIFSCPCCVSKSPARASPTTGGLQVRNFLM